MPRSPRREILRAGVVGAGTSGRGVARAMAALPGTLPEATRLEELLEPGVVGHPSEAPRIGSDAPGAD